MIIITTKSRDICWQQAERHARTLLADLGKAHTKGQTKKADYLTGRYLDSYDARLVATRTAVKALPKRRRPPESEIPRIASNLRAWRGTDEKVAVCFKPKKGNPGKVRTLMDFGIENRALQHLVLSGLKARANTHPRQFATQGGTHAAIKAACDALLGGYRHVAEIDISSCYPSFDEEQLSGLLPVPKEVVERVILSRNLNLVPDKKWMKALFGVGDSDEEDKIVFSFSFGGEIEAARRGIPQGSAVSPLVTDCLLAPVLHQMPNHGIVLNYADNFLIMAKKEDEAVSMQKALCCALEAHPAGPLLPKKPRHYEPGQAVEFLGYTLALTDSTCLVAPLAAKLQVFEEQFRDHLQGVLAVGLSLGTRRHRLQCLRRSVVGWSAAHALWKGAAQHREERLAVLKKAAASLGIVDW